MANPRETKARDAFRKASEGLFRSWLVENQLTAGMSDILAINRRGTVFWLELKALEEWPIRENTMPLKSKFERGQIPFLKEWSNTWKGNGFVLLRVGTSEWFLMSPHDSKGIPVKEFTRAHFEYCAVVKGLENIVKYLEQLA